MCVGVQVASHQVGDQVQSHDDPGEATELLQYCTAGPTYLRHQENQDGVLSTLTHLHLTTITTLRPPII